MATDKSVRIPDSVRRQLLSLSHRVSWLEAALKPEKEKHSPRIDRVWADFERKNAERKTRGEAMRDYYEQERIARYRANPRQLAIARALERKENAFLKSKGLKPNPSQIPKELRRRRRP